MALEEAVAAGNVVLVLERMELAVMTAPLAPWLLAGALDRGAYLAATCLAGFVEKLGAVPLARRMDWIEVAELTREDAAAVLRHLRETLAAHHRVAIDAPVVEGVVARSLTLAGRQPDKAITLLDAAAARAALMRQTGGNAERRVLGGVADEESIDVRFARSYYARPSTSSYNLGEPPT